MPLPLGTAINPVLVGFLEKGLVDQAAATFARNPVAARQILTTALAALFAEPVGPLILLACAAAAAAWFLQHYGEDPPIPPPQPGTPRIFENLSGSGMEVILNGGFGDAVVASCPNTVIRATQNSPNPDFPDAAPTYVKLDRLGGGVSYLSAPSSQPLVIVSCKTCPTPTAPSRPVEPNTDYEPLTDDQKALLRGVVTALVPSGKKPAPPDLQPQLQPLLDGLADLAKKLAECCAEDKSKLDQVLAEIDKVLKRVKRVSVNIGLPDLDGSNYGNIAGPFDVRQTDLAGAIDFMWQAIGPWSDTDTIEIAGNTLPSHNIYQEFKNSARRIGYFKPVEIDAAIDTISPATNVQTHIQKTRAEGADPSFHLGYGGTEAPADVITIRYTDKSKFKRRQAAQFTLPNPVPTIDKEQILQLLGDRLLGGFWCTFQCEDNTKLVGWFDNRLAGLSFLTRAAGLQRSGPKNPVVFTCTEKTVGVPAIAGTVLTPTAYAWNKLISPGNYTLIKEQF